MKHKMFFFIFCIVCISNVFATNYISYYSDSDSDTPCLNGIGPLLPGQDYCDESQNPATSGSSSIFDFLINEHYELVFNSFYTDFLKVEKYGDSEVLINGQDCLIGAGALLPGQVYCDQIAKVSFGFDLNNMNPALEPDEYDNFESYNIYNYVRPSTSSSILQNFEEYGYSALPSEINKFDYDFFGPPIYIESCFIECDNFDNTPATSWSMDQYSPFGDVWTMSVSSFTSPVSWLDSRLPDDRRLRLYENSLRFQYNDFSCVYDDMYKTQQGYVGCTFKLNPMYRLGNIDTSSDFYGFNDILDSFSTAPDDASYWTIRKRFNVNLLNENGTAEEFNVTFVGSEKPFVTNPGGYSDYSQNQQEESVQRSVEQLATNIERQNGWQKMLIIITNTIFSFLLIIVGLVNISVIGFVFIKSIPYIFIKITDKIEQMSEIQPLGFKIRRGKV